MANERQITVWECDHCNQRYNDQKRADRHELHCRRNQHRQPRQGELSPPYTGDNQPSWSPGPGRIWTGTRWAPVKGHSVWRTERQDGLVVASECWPDTADGTRLDKHPEHRRLEAAQKAGVIVGGVK